MFRRQTHEKRPQVIEAIQRQPGIITPISLSKIQPRRKLARKSPRG
jgi:hypothetical protein